MRTSHYLLTALLPFATALAQPEILFDGVLGNSGNNGDTLVRYDKALPIGAGVAADSLGFFWATGGSGRINRYAADGRLIGAYAAPLPSAEPKRLASTPELIVLLASDVISTLPVNSEPGSTFHPLAEVKATLMSSNVWENQVAIWKKDDLSLVNVQTGEVRKLAAVPAANAIEIGPDGAVYVDTREGVLKFDNQGQPVAGWPRKNPGSGLIRVGDHFYSFWHSSTLLRMTLDLEPDPGVVLGGGSGSVIARMPVDPDLRVTSGVAEISPNVFAAAGYGGTVMLLYWNEKANAFEVKRRIGGLPSCRGVGISKDGWVVANAGAWRPDAKPDSPLTFGSPLDPDGMLPVSFMKTGMMIAPALRYGGRPHLVSMAWTRDSDLGEVKQEPFTIKATASTLANWENRETLFVGEPDGTLRGYLVDGRGELQKALGVIALKTAQPIKRLDSLAPGAGGQGLIATADGFIIELSATAGAWEETDRWNTFGSETFGAQVFAAVDGAHLWVSDTLNDRVLCFDLASRNLIATYRGGEYAPKKPQIISANRGRAVFYDAGNQRLQRLKLTN